MQYDFIFSNLEYINFIINNIKNNYAFDILDLIINLESNIESNFKYLNQRMILYKKILKIIKTTTNNQQLDILTNIITNLFINKKDISDSSYIIEKLFYSKTKFKKLIKLSIEINNYNIITHIIQSIIKYKLKKDNTINTNVMSTNILSEDDNNESTITMSNTKNINLDFDLKDLTYNKLFNIFLDNIDKIKDNIFSNIKNINNKINLFKFLVSLSSFNDIKLVERLIENNFISKLVDYMNINYNINIINSYILIIFKNIYNFSKLYFDDDSEAKIVLELADKILYLIKNKNKSKIQHYYYDICINILNYNGFPYDEIEELKKVYLIKQNKLMKTKIGEKKTNIQHNLNNLFSISPVCEENNSTNNNCNYQYSNNYYTSNYWKTNISIDVDDILKEFNI